MGDIISGIGSLIGGKVASDAEQHGAEQALTGYNYLTKSPMIQAATGNGAAANNDIYSLLTSPTQNNPAFKNYLNSTGYNFQLQQGTNAITGSAAAKGLLNSGATAKALTGYGQGLASNYFNTYLSQLGGLSGQGLTAAGMVGQAGTTGGGNAGNLWAQSGQSQGTAIANAGNMFGSNSSMNFLGNAASMAMPFLGI